MWAWIGILIVLIALVVILFIANDASSVQIGAWAQVVAALGAVFAAFLAFGTADTSRKQAEHTSRAMATATRPRLALTLTPQVGVTPLPEYEQSDLTLTISNQSQFDVKDGRIEWEKGDGATGEREFGPIFAAANPESGSIVGSSVSYAGERKSHQYIPIGQHENFKAGTIRVTLYYSNIFSIGLWREIHYWKTSDINNNPGAPHWSRSHTYDPPELIPTTS